MTADPTHHLDFDAYIAVDFSANKRPKQGKDSIWWSRASWLDGRLVVTEARNPGTRDIALNEVRDELFAAVERRESVLIGFDFPCGYPAGFANALGLSAPAWRSTWSFLRVEIQDDQHLRSNNRFEVAARINNRLGGSGPFWGCPAASQTPG
jgi:precorrin-8X/cobalt-precorrin-8 methylmutase